MKNVYLASHLGFIELGGDNLVKFHKVLEKFHILDPWANQYEEEFDKLESITDLKQYKIEAKKVNQMIGQKNEDMINKSDLMVAILDGVDVDSGVAVEIGYAFSKMPIIGYRSDIRESGSNIAQIVNLQVEHFIEKSGGTIVKSLSELEEIIKKY